MQEINRSTLEFYNSNADDYVALTRQLDLSSQRNRFLELVQQGGQILDVGCGSGRDLKAFLDTGYTAIGVDASREMVQRSIEYSGARCHLKSFDEIQWQEEFDGIWACASLLHVPKTEIILVLKKLYDALKTGGIMYISLREGVEDRYHPDGRFFANYSLEEFTGIASSVYGLKVIEHWKNKDLTHGKDDVYWLNFLLKRTA